MGMSAGTTGGKKRAVAEINVTPMVDVMLVLLVIFMITAPSIKQIEGMEVNLPELKEGSAAETILTEDAWTVAVTAEGQVARRGSKKAEDTYPNLTELVGDLKKYREESEKSQKKPAVVIAGDKDAKYKDIMLVWNAVKVSGIRNVSFQVDSQAPEEKESPKAEPKK
jgi:biopolymer transport protein TolR